MLRLLTQPRFHLFFFCAPPATPRFIQCPCSALPAVNAFITMPGGIGTFEEFFETLTWAQLGVHRKPIGLLDVDRFWDPLEGLLSPAYAKLRRTLIRKDRAWTELPPAGDPRTMTASVPWATLPTPTPTILISASNRRFGWNFTTITAPSATTRVTPRAVPWKRSPTDRPTRRHCLTVFADNLQPPSPWCDRTMLYLITPSLPLATTSTEARHFNLC
jgi:hypothetical protein